MLIKGFPAGSWATNAYVVAAGPGEPAIIIDPGQDSINGINEIVRENRLVPAAVILTHDESAIAQEVALQKCLRFHMRGDMMMADTTPGG